MSHTFPSTALAGILPTSVNRLSSLLFRLSPSTKYSSFPSVIPFGGRHPSSQTALPAWILFPSWAAEEIFLFWSDPSADLLSVFNLAKHCGKIQDMKQASAHAEKMRHTVSHEKCVSVPAAELFKERNHTGHNLNIQMRGKVGKYSVHPLPSERSGIPDSQADTVLRFHRRQTLLCLYDISPDWWLQKRL